MNTVQILEQLQDLKLSGMHESYKTQLELPLNQQLEGHELLAHLLQSEKHHRGNERLAALLRAAKLRYAAQPQSVECNAARNLTKANWAQLMEGNYITASENILITGATGSGKSHLACALGYQACQLGVRTRYFNMNRLIESISIARTEGSYLKFINQLERVPVIILDDLGLQTMNKNMKLTILQILEDRYGKKSIIVTSQLPVETWYEYFDEPTLADAIMDRMTAKCHRIELTGESRRRRKSNN
jgi:DNA replication protein DnaC